MAPNKIVFAVRNPLKTPIVGFDGDKLPTYNTRISVPNIAETFKIPTWKAKEVAFILRNDVKMNFLEEHTDHTVVISYEPSTKSMIYTWAKANRWEDKFSRSFGTRVATERCENIRIGKYPIINDVKTVDHLKYILPKSVHNNFMYYVERGFKYFKDQQIDKIKVYAKIYDPVDEDTNSFTLDIDVSNIVRQS